MSDIEEQFTRLSKLTASDLEPGALTPDPRAVAAARQFLNTVWLCPLNSGGVQMAWHTGDADVEVSFNPDGTVEAISAEHNGAMWYSDEPHTTRPSVAPAGDALIGASDQGETTELAVTTCDWFQWCGGATCDNCGRNPGEHRGVEWLAKGASPFGSERDNVHVEWKDYGPGRSLNVPFLTSCMGNGQLEALQGISSAPAGDPQGGEE